MSYALWSFRQSSTSGFGSFFLLFCIAVTVYIVYKSCIESSDAGRSGRRSGGGSGAGSGPGGR